MGNNGFTVNTKVWHSVGVYRDFKDLMQREAGFMTDSFDIEQLDFVTNMSDAVEVGENTEFIDVTYGSNVKLGTEKDITVRCTPGQKFLTCYENNGTLHYKGNETFFWVEAKNLKEGRRLVAEDANIVVKKIEKVNASDKVYSVKSRENLDNFSIKLGVIVECA